MGETIRYPNMGSTAKAAEIYGVTPHYIRLLCKAGKVRFVRYGRHILVNLDSLARYFEQGDPSPAEQVNNVSSTIRQVPREHTVWRA